MNAAIFAGLFAVIVLAGWFIVKNRSKDGQNNTK